MKTINLLAVLALFFVTQLQAQTANAPRAPSDRAVDWSAADIVAAAQYLSEQGIATRRLLEGGIFSVNVRHLEGAETALQHGRITEVWVVTEGSGLLVTGGEILDAEDNGGPGDLRGSGIRGGVERQIAAGDVIYVPTFLPHGIRETESITYLNIRFELRDPD